MNTEIFKYPSFIFLDIDGVINPTNNFVKAINENKSVRNDEITFSEEPMKALKYLVEETGSTIILSSAWGMGWNSYNGYTNPVHRNIVEQLHKYNLFIADATPTREDRVRGLEIKDWLELYKSLRYNINSIEEIPYLILDDELTDIIPFHKSMRCVGVNKDIGFTMEDAINCIDLLSIQQQKIKSIKENDNENL